MDSELIANFCAITDATDGTAEYYLSAAGGDLDMAIGLFYESGTGPAGKNIHEISAEMSSRNADLTTSSAQIVLSDSESDEVGEVVMATRPTAVSIDNQSEGEEEEEDLVFNNAGNTNTSRRLADLFRPPHGIMFNGTFELARRFAREINRWLLVTVHAPTDFASQAMNRDLWNSSLLQSFVKENFVFVQMIVGGTDERRYQSFYPYDGLYPHVALIDPRTGERVDTLLIASIPVPGFKLISTDRDMLELLGEFIAEHPMDAIGDQRKRSSSSPKLEQEPIELEEPEIKRQLVENEAKNVVQRDNDNVNVVQSDNINVNVVKSEHIASAESENVNSAIPEIVPNYVGPDAILIQFRLPNGQRHRHRFNPNAKAPEIFQTAAAASQLPPKSFKLRTAEGEVDESSVDISKLNNTMLTIIK